MQLHLQDADGVGFANSRRCLYTRLAWKLAASDFSATFYDHSFQYESAPSTQDIQISDLGELGQFLERQCKFIERGQMDIECGP